jgi:hypothetical protein
MREQMETSDIQIDKDGIWYYRGAHMFRKEILCVFFEHLKIDDCGRYFIELDNEIYYLDVEDTAFVVTAVYKTHTSDNGHEQIEVLLSDDCREVLDPDSLSIGRDNVMYCRVKGGRFVARFVRKSYYQLAEFIEEDETENGFRIVLNNRKYLINNS